MGIFDFLKSKKNILTENGVNYIYYNGNGKLKEKFTMINGVLHGEYFKYDASGSIYSIRVFNNGIDINTGKEEKINYDYLMKPSNYDDELNKSIVLDNLNGTQSGNKYTNKSGYKSALILAFLYAYFTPSDGFNEIVGNFGAIVITGNIIAFCISIFWKSVLKCQSHQKTVVSPC